MAKLIMSPILCAYPDEKGEFLLIEVELPGVKKEDIHFKMFEDSFYIEASKADIDYRGSYMTYCPVKPNKAVAKYENGLLKVTVPYKDLLEGTVDVEIN